MPRTRKASDSMEPSRAVARGFLLALLGGSLLLAYTVVAPFLHPIVFAAVLASMFHPLAERLRRHKRLRRRDNLVALVTVVAIALIIVIPLFLVSLALVDQGVDFFTRARAWLSEGNLSALLHSEWVSGTLTTLRERFPTVSLDAPDLQSTLMQSAKRMSELLLTKGSALVGNAAGMLAQFFVMMFVTFYLVRDGRRMLETVKHLSPLHRHQEEGILQRIAAAARSVLQGSMLTAVAQGVAGGIGFALVGIPGAFWGTMLAFASLIPVVGTALVWVPAALYLVLIGSWKSALFLAAWSALVVGSIDNFLRPFLMQGQGGLSPFFIFLAILGGVQAFGMPGILYGPLILAFARAMLHVYEEEFRDLLGEPPEEPAPDS